MKKSILLFCILLFTNQFALGQACEGTSKPTPHFGVHPGISFSNIWNEFGSGYGAAYSSVKYSGTGDVVIDNTGWTKAGQIHNFYISIRPDLNANLKVQPGDIFYCRYKGLASQLVNINGDATFQNIVQTGAYVTYEIKVISSKTRAQLDRFDYNVNGHIEEIQIMRPNYVLDDPRFLTDECVDYLRGTQALRLMGASGCNSTKERTWANRTPANAPFSSNVWTGYQIQGNVDNPFDDRGDNPYRTDAWEQQKPYPYEKAIDVCNYLDKDFYLNLPVLADENYVAQLSALIKSRLKPSLNVYIEIGNELWNFGGGGAFQGFAMSFAAVAHMINVEGDMTIVGGGTSPLPAVTTNVGNGTWWTGGFGAYDLARRWPAYRLKKYMDIFANDFGFADQGGVGVRIRPVLAGQLDYGWGGDYWFIGSGLDIMDKLYGPDAARKYIYGVAIAHYTNVKDDPTKTIAEMKAMSLDDIFTQLYQNTDARFAEYGAEGDCRTNPFGNCEGNEFEDILALAKRRGIKVMAYEGGHEINIQRNGAWIPLNNIVAAYNDPRMYEHTKYYMTKWYSWMGYDALFFKNGFFTQPGYGAGYAVAQVEGEISQQYRAYRDIIDNPAPPLTQDRGGIIGLNPVSLLPGNKIASYDYIGNHQGGVEITDSMVINSNIYGAYGRRLDGTLNLTKDVYILRNETSGQYKLNLKMNYNGDNTYYDVYMDGNLIKANWHLNQGAGSIGAERLRYSDSIVFAISYGTHALLFTKSTIPGAGGSLDLHALKITLLGEKPPAMPQLIYGDLAVCGGNPNAKYEVSPVDFSVCDYVWSGLPGTAKFLPTSSLSGQGLYKINVDWGSTSNGIYNLTVVARNQSKLPGNDWQESTPRLFQVELKTCGFTVVPSGGCAPLNNVSFTPTTMPGIVTKLEWDLSPGATPQRAVITTLLSSIVTASYANVGIYDVSLKVYLNGSGIPSLFYYNKVNAKNCSEPAVVTPVSYCLNAPAVPLIAYGTALKWYNVSIGGIGSTTVPKPVTSSLGTNTYWVSQTVDIESARSRIDVITSVIEPITLTGQLTLCGTEGTTITATGANIYTWSPPIGLSSTNGPVVTITKTGASNYTVTGSVGICSVTKVFTITATPLPSISSVVKSHLSNCSIADGSITLVGSGGFLPYQFSQDNFFSTNNGTGIFTGLTIGTYNGYIRNSVNPTCSNTFTGIVITTSSSPSISSTSKTDITSCGLSNGSATITGTGGTGILEYSINGSSWQVSNVFTGLASSTFTPYIRNQNSTSCSISGAAFTITALSAPSISSSIKTDINNCGLSNGSVTITGTGGTGTLEYSIDGSLWQVSNVFTGLASSTFTPYVKNQSSQSCSATGITFAITTPSAPSISSVLKTDISNCDLSNGSATITGTGSTGTLEYSIDGTSWVLTNIFPGLANNTFTPYVRNQSNQSCSISGSAFIITASGVPSISINSLIHATCGSSNGAITLNATSGNPPYEFSINNFTTAQSSNIFPGLAPKTYTLSVRNQNSPSCISSITGIEITSPGSCLSTLTFSGVPTIDCLINALGTGYTFLENISTSSSVTNRLWEFGNGASRSSSNLANPGVIKYLTSGLKTVTLTVTLTGGNILSSTQTFSIDQMPQVSSIIASKNVICKGSSSTLSVSQSSGIIKWYSRTGIADSYQLMATTVTSFKVTPETSTTYLVTAENGVCPVITTTSLSVSVDLPVKGTISGPDSTCESIPAILNFSGDNAFKVWQQQINNQWLTVDSSNALSLVSNTFTGITLFRAVMKSRNACPDAKTNAKEINFVKSSSAGVAIAKDNEICEQIFTTISLSSYWGNIAWQVSTDSTFTSDLVNDNQNETKLLPVYTTPDMKEFGTQLFFRAAINLGNCPLLYSNVVKVKVCNLTTYIPNALTPNSGDVNSSWDLTNANLRDVAKIKVFNRYGTQVYSASGKEIRDNPWNGGGLPAGTYYYVIDPSDTRSKRTGAVTIIK